jgi:hypothetical protein
MRKKLIQLVLIIMLVMGMTVAAQAQLVGTITVGTDLQVCDPGDTVDIAITIDSRGGLPDCSFSVSFNPAVLEYVATIPGNMDTTVYTATPEDVNTAGKVQPIVMFGTATSGTIATFQFTLLSSIQEGVTVPLVIGDILPSVYDGVDGLVGCSACDITIDPVTATVNEGESISFTSETTPTVDPCAPAVQVWSVSTTIPSKITQAGVYTAGLTDATVTDIVTVTDTANLGINASAIVTVNPITCTVSISPATDTVDCWDEIEFGATSSCSGGTYTWSKTTTIGSTIDQNGKYTAGENITGGDVTDTITVTDTANGNVTATATITVRDCTVKCKDLTLNVTEGKQGQTYKIKLSTEENMFKNVKKANIVVDFGSGITVNKIMDKSNNSIKVEITIDKFASIGTTTVSVETLEDCAEGKFRVKLGPSILISPATGHQKEKLEDVTITGINTYFVKGKTTVKFDKGIEVSKVTVFDNNPITMNVKISKKAKVGPHTLTVTTKLGGGMKEVATYDYFIVLGASE